MDESVPYPSMSLPLPFIFCNEELFLDLSLLVIEERCCCVRRVGIACSFKTSLMFGFFEKIYKYNNPCEGGVSSCVKELSK